MFKKNICRDWMQKDDGIMKHIFQIAEPVSVIVGDEYLYFLASITNNNYRGFIRASDRARRHKVSSNAESTSNILMGVTLVAETVVIRSNRSCHGRSSNNLVKHV